MNPLTPLNQIAEETIIDLVERMDVRGPRYTSYPTAPVWKNGFTEVPYKESLARLGQSGDPLALYLHLPYCHKRCFYCGCNSFISNQKNTIDAYTERMLKEVDSTAQILGSDARHAWLHLGGGTPTHMEPEMLARILDHVMDAIPGIDGAERSIEVDPRITTDEHIKLLAERGFRRISIGLQDLHPEVQKAVQREFTFEEMSEFVAKARAAGFTSINIDLIYGLPLQNRDRWNHTLEQVGIMKPNRIATFGYAHLPDKIKHQRLIKDDQLPSPRERLGMLLDAQHFFTDQGYTSIGMDHFATKEDKLTVAHENGTLWRNFMGYTEIRGLEMVGLGASSIGELNDMFVQNIPLPEGYNKAIDEKGWAVFRGHLLSEEDRIRKAMINDIMCNLRVRVPENLDDLNAEIADDFRRIIKSFTPYEDEGLISTNGDGYRVKPLGQMFLRNLAMHFDQYLPDQEGVTFSRTI